MRSGGLQKRGGARPAPPPSRALPRGPWHGPTPWAPSPCPRGAPLVEQVPVDEQLAARRERALGAGGPHHVDAAARGPGHRRQHAARGRGVRGRGQQHGRRREARREAGPQGGRAGGGGGVGGAGGGGGRPAGWGEGARRAARCTLQRGGPLPLLQARGRGCGGPGDGVTTEWDKLHQHAKDPRLVTREPEKHPRPRTPNAAAPTASGRGSARVRGSARDARAGARAALRM
jgi:hypothetical protein